MTGRQHLANMDSKIPSSIKKVPGSSDTVTVKNVRYCHDCSLALTSDVVATQHYNGKRHLENVAANKEKPGGQRGAAHGSGVVRPLMGNLDVGPPAENAQGEEAAYPKYCYD